MNFRFPIVHPRVHNASKPRFGEIKVPFAFYSGHEYKDKTLAVRISMKVKLTGADKNLSPIPTRTGQISVEYESGTPYSSERLEVGEYADGLFLSAKDFRPVSIEEIKPLIEAMAPSPVIWHPEDLNAEETELRSAVSAMRNFPRVKFESPGMFWHGVTPALQFLQRRVAGEITPPPLLPQEVRDFDTLLERLEQFSKDIEAKYDKRTGERIDNGVAPRQAKENKVNGLQNLWARFIDWLNR